MEDIILELIEDDSFDLHNDQYKKVLMKLPGNFGMIFSTCLRPKDSKFPNFSVWNIDIFLPSETFDKMMSMLGEEYKKHITKNVADSTILKIDDKITLFKEDSTIMNPDKIVATPDGTKVYVDDEFYDYDTI